MSWLWLGRSIALLFLAWIVELLRRRRLREQHALVWLLVAVVMLLVTLDSRLVDGLARRLGIAYAPSLLLVFGLLFSFLVILSQTISISHLTERVTRLSQELALLKHELERHQVDEGLSRKNT